jgi:Fur family transcriptional regulator, peroxide stress response regulator
MRTTPTNAELGERCRAAGLKVTPQRLAVYGALTRRHDHPSPELLFQEVRKKQPGISLATIYKTLDALEAAGLVREVAHLQNTKRYDARQGRHQHLVCTACEAIQDLDLPIDTSSIPHSVSSDFDVAEIHVHILGVCSSCRGKRRRK